MGTGLRISMAAEAAWPLHFNGGSGGDGGGGGSSSSSRRRRRRRRRRRGDQRAFESSSPAEGGQGQGLGALRLSARHKRSRGAIFTASLSL